MKCQLLTIATVLLLAAPAWGDFDDGQAAYERGDYETAFEEWLPLAEQGNAGAQQNFGVIYENGQGVERDYAEAEKWFLLAAEQGHTEAQARLNEMYAPGEDIEKYHVDPKPIEGGGSGLQSKSPDTHDSKAVYEKSI